MLENENMFDLGLAKLIIIGIVALMVMGPQHLLRVARTLGKWLGQMQHTFHDMKTQITQLPPSLEEETPVADLPPKKRGLKRIPSYYRHRHLLPRRRHLQSSAARVAKHRHG